MQVTINTNFKELGRWMSDIERKQLPYATARALTAVAKEGVEAVQGELRARFTLRNRYSERGVRSQFARKADWPRPFSRVGIDERRSYLADHVEGGIRRPQRAKWRAVPGVNNRRTRTGKIRKADRASRSLRVPGGRGRKKYKAFERGNLILRRAGRGGRQLKVLHVTTSQVRIDARLPMEAAVTKVVQRRYGRHFNRELAAAVRSGRGRRS